MRYRIAFLVEYIISVIIGKNPLITFSLTGIVLGLVIGHLSFNKFQW